MEEPITDTETISEEPQSFEPSHEHTCDNCGDEFTGPYEKMQLCGRCGEDRAMAALSKVEPPDGGWPRGSDMDRL